MASIHTPTRGATCPAHVDTLCFNPRIRMKRECGLPRILRGFLASACRHTGAPAASRLWVNKQTQ